MRLGWGRGRVGAPLKDLDGNPTPATLVLGQVVGVHIDPAFLREGLFDLVAAGTIARCGYHRRSAPPR